MWVPCQQLSSACELLDESSRCNHTEGVKIVSLSHPPTMSRVGRFLLHAVYICLTKELGTFWSFISSTRSHHSAAETPPRWRLSGVPSSRQTFCMSDTRSLSPQEELSSVFPGFASCRASRLFDFPTRTGMHFIESWTFTSSIYPPGRIVHMCELSTTVVPSVNPLATHYTSERV